MSIIIIGYSLLLAIVSGIGIIRYKRLAIPFKVLTLWAITEFLLSIASRFFSVRYKNNIPVEQIATIAEYVFYSTIYYYLFKNKIVKKIILVSIVLSVLFFLINAAFLQPFNKAFPTNLSVPAQILFVLFSLLLFKQMLLYPLNINITKQSIFWFNTAVLFYSSTMFLIMALENYYAKHNLLDYYIYYFWYGMLYIFYILIGISILTVNKEAIKTYA